MAKDEIVDVEEEGRKENTFLTGLVVVTTVALLVAFFVIEKAWGENYGRGLFGGG